MIIKECKYKGVNAYELKTKNLTAIVIPSQGGKIASVKDNESQKEYLLQNPSKEFLRTGLNDNFVDGECCGFDDMFPTIDPVTVTGGDKKEYSYPDHGEVCRVPFLCSLTEKTITLRYFSDYLGYEYIKTLSENSDGKLEIFYQIKNLSGIDLDVLWAGHCIVKQEKGGNVIVPFKDGEQVDVMFDTSNTLKSGDRIPYKSEYLFSEWNDDEGYCKKFYFPKKAVDGYVCYRYPDGKIFCMEFDKEQLPYVGIWQNNGGLNNEYCVGLEPCSVGYDTVKNAEKYGQKRLIKYGETMQFTIKLSIK